MPLLNATSRATAFADTTSLSTPQRKLFDWTRNFTNIPVTNPQVSALTVPPGASASLWNNLVSTSISSSTAFTVTLSPLQSNLYRLTNSGGTAPAFRTDRGLAFNTKSVTVAQNADATATWTVSGSTWGSTVAGDWVFIPGPTTGDASTVFDVSNQGFWVVIAILSSTQVQLTRFSNATFNAASETVTVGANSQVQAFSSAGVQLGNTMALGAGFTASTLGEHIISGVTPSWVEFQSDTAIALETGIVPGVTGMVFYSSAKRFIRIESDQVLTVRLNGSTDSTVKIEPLSPGDPEQIGWLEKLGPAYALTVINNSLVAADVTVFSAE